MGQLLPTLRGGGEDDAPVDSGTSDSSNSPADAHGEDEGTIFGLHIVPCSTHILIPWNSEAQPIPLLSIDRKHCVGGT